MPTLSVLLLASIALFGFCSHATAYAGSEACADCHAEEYANWQGSHHDLAMQLPAPDNVLGDFNNATFDYNGVTSTFYRKGDKYIVSTDGEDGKLTDFEVSYVFGVYPLQQVLLPLSRGRLQALTIAWDARPEEEGGQRWYHLYPDEPIGYSDPLHWTGPYMNWNTRCAECHSTDLQKNYNAADRSFETTFEEINVGCEACHGPGEKHLELAGSGELGGAAGHGLATELAQRGEWAFAQGEAIASRLQPLESRAQVDSCGRCHARRGTLGDYHYGADLLDTHRLSLPLSPLYHHDGQILDEVYVYGSFLQSKMQQAGVVCSNCHEPHSNALRAEGNGVCAQCHQPARYDTVEHHNHPADSAGAQCANCHMPETTYMGVDPRRDHSMRVPRPDLSLAIGTPNACNQCHTDQDARWARDALKQWGTEFSDTAAHPAVAFHQAAGGDGRAVPTLAALVSDEQTAPIMRAAAIETLGRFGGRDALQAATTTIYSDDPLLRVSTIRALEFLPPHQRLQLMQPLFDDEVTAVRMALAIALAEVPLDQIPPAQAQQLEKIFREYERINRSHADMPASQLSLGVFFVDRGDIPSAEAAYREALAINPQLIPGYLNLADLLRSQNREEAARKVLLLALDNVPDNGDTLHSLGLLETRTGNSEQALAYLSRAAELETVGTRHRYIYAIALHDLGKPRQAVQQLQALLRQVPGNEEVLLALANYSAELGQIEKARYYAQELIRIAPGNTHYVQLYRQLAGSPSQ